MRRTTWPAMAALALGGLLVAFLALPVLAVVGRALLDGLAVAAATTAAVRDALWLSLYTTALAMLITVGLGTPLAAGLARRHGRLAALVESFVDLPIVLPPSVAGLALLLVFGRRGVFGDALDGVGLTLPFTTLAVVLAQTFVSAPFYVRSARAGLAAVEREVEDAARVDGASDWQVARWISLPLASPALAAGLVMCWARALGEFGATIMFAGSIAGVTRTLPLLVYGEFQAADLEAAIAAAAILVLAALAVLLAVRLLRWPRAFDLRVA
jgi:molybdate transport system permease protein